ncbi:hypothetical protein AAUPMC_01242, partial [Pasteurella multocida subsp. multocida str. Anand1_cattle]
NFGGRFMAQALATVRGEGKITILTVNVRGYWSGGCPRFLWFRKH